MDPRNPKFRRLGVGGSTDSAAALWLTSYLRPKPIGEPGDTSGASPIRSHRGTGRVMGNCKRNN